MTANPSRVAQTVRARRQRDAEAVLAAHAHLALLDEADLRELARDTAEHHPELVIRGVRRLARADETEVTP